MNFTHAAEELNLTQSAVSRQIRSLEDILGRRLFGRVSHRLVLTTEGQRYAEKVAAILDQISVATLDIMVRVENSSALTIGVPPTLGALWLLPRLPRFVNLHPSTQVSLVTIERGSTLLADTVDVAIWFKGEAGPDFVEDPLCDEMMIAVCSPSLIAGAKNLGPALISDYPLLQVTTRPRSWDTWFTGHGVKPPPSSCGIKIGLFYLAIQAAKLGLGVGIFPEILVREDLASGVLVAPFGGSIPSDESYMIAVPERKSKLKPVNCFREWVTDEFLEHSG